MIPQSAAASIGRAAVPGGFDATALAREARKSASVAIPLVNALIARVLQTDETAGRYVHWGATSQDAINSAMILLLWRARNRPAHLG